MSARQPAASVTAIASPDRRSGWRTALVVLVLGLAALLVLFGPEASAAVSTWSTSTAYNHCWLIFPIAGWLAWQRRGRLTSLLPAPSWGLATLALPFAVGWLAAERLGIMEGRQLAALALIEVFVLAVVGWRIGRAMAAPLAYLVFLVPFGEFAVPLLQVVTGRMIELGLSALGIPHYTEGLLIDTPAGAFHVAEACAGLRFIIAALAFGALYAFTVFRSPGRRLLVMALALGVPVLANGARALGIVVLAQHLGSAEAAAADHLVYGWAFFSVVILLLIAAGLPFRQDSVPLGTPRPAAPRSISPHNGRVALAGTAALLMAAGGPAAAGLLRGAADGPVVATVALPFIPGCVAAESGALRCGTATVTAKTWSFPARTTWAPIAATRRRLGGEDDTARTLQVNTADAEWLLHEGHDGDVVAVAAWRDGAPAGDGLVNRARQGWQSLRPSAEGPLVAAVTVRGTEQGAASLQSMLPLLPLSVFFTAPRSRPADHP